MKRGDIEDERARRLAADGRRTNAEVEARVPVSSRPENGNVPKNVRNRMRTSTCIIGVDKKKLKAFSPRSPTLARATYTVFN